MSIRLGLSIAGGVATVDLSGEFATGGGSASSQYRLAQVTYTLTQFETVDSVLFKVDGTVVTVFGSEGIVLTGPVGRDRFEDQLPAVFVDRPAFGAAMPNLSHVTGTANVFEATVSIEVRDEHGDVVLRTFTTATSGNGTRGTFDTVLPLPSTSGNATITAFEASAEDGRPLHEVDVPVTLGR